jgi:hypothetical protein
VPNTVIVSPGKKFVPWLIGSIEAEYVVPLVLTENSTPTPDPDVE